jgi:hypothetical protein
LDIRVEAMGKKGECKYCGHRFLPKAELASKSLPGRPVANAPGTRDRATNLGQRVETLERSLEQSWARLSAKRESVIEQLISALEAPPIQPEVAVKERAGAPSRLARNHARGTQGRSSDWADGVEPPDEELVADLDENDRIELRFEDQPRAADPPGAVARDRVPVVPDGKFEIVGAGTDLFQFEGEVPTALGASGTPPAIILEGVNRLVEERNEARVECARLAHHLDRVRLELEHRLSEVARLQKKAERLRAVRAERDRLNAERAMLAREATQIQGRMVEAQVELVEVGAELDDFRERYSAERQEWQQHRQELLAEIDRLNAALVEAETRECAPVANG